MTDKILDIKHSQSDPIVGNGKYKSNYLIEGNAATLFPRPASTFLLQEQDSDEAEIDFSVEKEMLKNQIKKAEDSFNGKLQHENSNTSFLDECNEEDEAMIVRMLKEIDSNEGLKSE
jgi:hypothetical protein